jgi:hypothetical protein
VFKLRPVIAAWLVILNELSLQAIIQQLCIGLIESRPSGPEICASSRNGRASCCREEDSSLQSPFG